MELINPIYDTLTIISFGSYAIGNTHFVANQKLFSFNS